MFITCHRFLHAPHIVRPLHFRRLLCPISRTLQVDIPPFLSSLRRRLHPQPRRSSKPTSDMQDAQDLYPPFPCRLVTPIPYPSFRPIGALRLSHNPTIHCFALIHHTTRIDILRRDQTFVIYLYLANSLITPLPTIKDLHPELCAGRTRSEELKKAFGTRSRSQSRVRVSWCCRP